ncbi:nucleoside phosphorylase domain-containing protein [Aspergillus navahoensis]
MFVSQMDRLGRYYGKQQGDAISYINGKIGDHNVVVCYMPGMGTRTTRIELALVVGICGGAQSPPDYREIFLGDVTIKRLASGTLWAGQFQRFGLFLNGLRAAKARDELQTQVLQYLQEGTTGCNYPQASDVLYKAAYLHKHYGRVPSIRCCCSEGDAPDRICEAAVERSLDDLGCYPSQIIHWQEPFESNISVYIGTVASGNMVIKSGQYRDTIAGKEEIIGFKMEGAGVWDHVTCLTIKTVCDYTDSPKNKSWQAYAAATGTSAAKAFLENWRPVKQEGY